MDDVERLAEMKRIIGEAMAVYTHEYKNHDAKFADRMRDKAAEQIKKLYAGYLPVEPVKLEVLGDDYLKNKFTGWGENSLTKIEVRHIVRDIITHNESKGQLYRRK